MLISRRVPPTSVTEPTPRTFSRRFLSTWSAQFVSSTALGGLAPTLVAARTALPPEGALPPWGGPAAGLAPTLVSPAPPGCLSLLPSGSTATDQTAREA